jgi:hypothetical protein
MSLNIRGFKVDWALGEVLARPTNRTLEHYSFPISPDRKRIAGPCWSSRPDISPDDAVAREARAAAREFLALGRDTADERAR